MFNFICWFRRFFGLTCAPAAVTNLRGVLRRGYQGGHVVSKVQLNWQLPTVDVNGNPLPAGDISSVKVTAAFNGGAPADMATIPNTPAAPATSYLTGPLASGSYVFTVETVDTAGDVSAASNAFSITVPLAPPAAISDLTGTLVTG